MPHGLTAVDDGLREVLTAIYGDSAKAERWLRARVLAPRDRAAEVMALRKWQAQR